MICRDPPAMHLQRLLIFNFDMKFILYVGRYRLVGWYRMTWRRRRLTAALHAGMCV